MIIFLFVVRKTAKYSNQKSWPPVRDKRGTCRVRNRNTNQFTTKFGF
jgi:hypothetical protein